MNHFVKYFILVVLYFSTSMACAITHSLKNKTVRSVVVHHQNQKRILVGNKGTKLGSAVLFESTDGGMTWNGLNDGKSLAAKATDIQAVAYTEKTLLAGTWKHGLYMSMDGGEHFNKHKKFPSNDIRDLKIVKSKPHIVFAATADKGIFKSIDGGVTWKKLSINTEFFWSLDILENGMIITATSPMGNVYLSEDSGESWKRIHQTKSPFFAAVNPFDSSQIIIASKDEGVLFTKDKGRTWTNIDLKPISKSFSTLSFTSPKDVVIGSWDNGILELDLVSRKRTHSFPNKSVSHVVLMNKAFVVGTWGEGLLVK